MFTTTTSSPISPKSYNISRTGGSPRSLSLFRRRRSPNPELMDIKTHEKVIQVVAPGDMAFSLSSSDVDESDFPSSVSQDFISNNNYPENMSSEVCIPTTSLVVGSVLLLLLLVVSILVSFFLYLRVRQVGKVAYVYNESAITYDNPEFMNSLSYSGVGVTHWHWFPTFIFIFF